MNRIKEIIDKAKGKVTFDNISSIDTLLDISGNIDDLKEDMLQIEYPNNIILDIGWFPSFDIEGHFCIQVIQDLDWGEPIMKIKCNSWKTLENSLDEEIQKYNKMV